jgi:hypothetical protein
MDQLENEASDNKDTGNEEEEKTDTTKKDTGDMSEEELRELIRPELFSLNIPALLEILFGLFLFFVAIIKILSGWYLLDSNTNSGLASGFLTEGAAFIILMCLSFYVAYGLILKHKYAPAIGLAKGIFFIVYFSYGAISYRNLAAEARSDEVIFLSDITEPVYYESQMYVSLLLLIFVLILSLAMTNLLFKQGFFNKVLKRNVKKTAEPSTVSIVSTKNDS